MKQRLKFLSKYLLFLLEMEKNKKKHGQAFSFCKNVYENISRIGKTLCLEVWKYSPFNTLISKKTFLITVED
jgi:hypothetical protein